MNRKVESTVMDGIKSKRIGPGEEHRDGWTKKLENSEKEQKLKSVVTGGVKRGKFGKLDNYENDDETMS